MAQKPFDQFDLLLSEDSATSYHIAPAARQFLNALPDDLRDRYGQLFLLWCIKRYPERASGARVLPAFESESVDYLTRIVVEIAGSRYPAGVGTDVFAKDLALARLSLVPAGAQAIFERAGIPARDIVQGGPPFWVHMMRCGGRKPFLEIHTHDPMVKTHFNKEGWERTYRLAAELLRHDSTLCGLTGSSWFYDPALAMLSPRLGYLRDVPVSRGARLFNLGSDSDTIRLATLTSETRRVAWEEGRYQPRRYALIWPRRALLAHYS